jgi:hypothetical protein
MLITGVLLGVIITLLIFAILYQAGVCKAMNGQLAKANEDLFNTRTMLGRFVAIEQERQKLKEAVVFNFTEEQITSLASSIGTRVQTLLNAAQDAALGKLN